MLRILNADKVNGIVAIEMGEKDLRNLIESVDNMVEKQQRTLLENLPSENQVRQKLADYKALKEEFRKIWESLIQ
jgi:trans-2-enoyl-CoA reductase